MSTTDDPDAPIESSVTPLSTLASNFPKRGRHGVAALHQPLSVARAHPYTLLVLVMGLALRAILVPLAHGDDFTVWDLAARYTLAGVNIYRDHPRYPGGPYAYFPLFLYVELPFRWLALHTGLSFTVLGKAPIVAGDLLTGILVARILARAGRGDAVVALGAALYLLNPLVLYNGAFYGRFDTLCAGLLLLALIVHDQQLPGRVCEKSPKSLLAPSVPSGGTPGEGSPQTPANHDRDGQTGVAVRQCTDPELPGEAAGAPGRDGAPGKRAWAFPLLYAVAVATKSYPVFLLPWLLAREPRGRGRLVAALAAVLGGLSVPYLLTSPRRFVADILLYDAHKTPGHLSWQVLLLGVLSPHVARLASYLLLALFVLALYLYRRLDLWDYCTVSILLFILLSKVVIEQYLLWPLPFLIIDALQKGSRASWGLLLLFSAAGMLVNAHIQPFGESPWPLALALATGIALYLATLDRHRRRVADAS